MRALSDRPKVLFVLKHIDYIDPMGIMLLSALAKQQGCETHLNVLSDRNLIATIDEVRPDVVAFSGKTGEHTYYVAANRAIKARYGARVKTLLGGPHPTFFPGVIDAEDFDAVCVGEGFEAWPEYLRAVIDHESVDDIPNIVTRANRGKSAPPLLRPRKKDLDSLPFFDRDLVYRRTRLGRFPMRCIMAGYGCPFPCTYCFNHTFNDMYRGKGKLYNAYSVDRLCAELAELKARWPTQFIKFYDDVFVFSDNEWLDEFVEKYPREVGLPFHCLVRCDIVSKFPTILTKLKQAGIRSISMSIESGHDYTREKIFKRGMTREQIVFAFGRCRELGIDTFSNSIYACPVPDEVAAREGKTAIERDIETLDLNLAAGVTYGEFGSLFPYPGNELAKWLIQEKFFDGNYDALPMNYSNASPLSCFTEKEKLMQHNLAFLSLLCLMFPRLRNLTVNVLIKLPLSYVYHLLYYFAKVYLIWFKIYPMKFGPRDVLVNFYHSFVLETFKRFGGRKSEDYYTRKGFFKRPATEMLAGPWQS
jgi:anaerobic magnesium-protoporphyrin IX monomethyl ester cyclase